ncbi:hypothetical protein AB0O29_11080, partial [Streptomyces sp. NPDC089915]
VAWDEWGKNPARAAGAVTFNVLTTVFTGGSGAAAKAGTAAKVISVAGKAGRLIDPITYIGKAAQIGKVKIGDLFANLGKVDGAFPKIDDVIWKDLPKADAPGVTFPHPEDTVRLPDDALGRPQYYDKTTHQLLDHNGLPKQDLTAIPKGPDHPLAEIPKHDPVPVTAGAHTAEATAHTPGGAADHTPHNSHTEPGSGPGTHGGTDTTPTGGGAHHTDTPGTGGGHGDGPGGGGDHGGPVNEHPLGDSENPHPVTEAQQADFMKSQAELDGLSRKKQIDLVGRGIEVNGVKYKPEAPLLKGAKHGIDWTEGPARASKEDKAQGRFGTPADVHYATERAAELGPGKTGFFKLPEGHGCIEYLPDGTTRIPNALFVKVYASGKVHAYPTTR